MVPPVRHLKPEWIPEHPALQSFLQFVAEGQGTAPPAQDVLVKNNKAQDGYIDLEYAKNGHIFLGRLNANGQILQLHHGQFRKNGGPPDWGKGPRDLAVAGSCNTLHVLGGEAESQIQCRDELPASQTTPRLLWGSGLAVTAWGGTEAAYRIWKGRSFTKGFIADLGKGLSLTQPKTPALRYLLREVPAAGVGLLSMHYSSYLSDAIGWHPRDQRHERWALSVGAGLFAQRATRGLLNQGKSRLTADPVSFGASLMSAALVDATVGQLWAENSWERRTAREIGFFLPSFLQGVQRDRELALFEKIGFGVQGKKWGGRLMVAGFLADLGYMTYNRVSAGPVGSVQINRLYARANQLHDQDMHPVTYLLKGAASFIAPALTERFLTPSSYVRKAGEEMRREDARYVTSLEGTLRHWVERTGRTRASDPESGWDWLRSDNRLEDARNEAGKLLPVASVAEQLADPKVASRLEGKSDAEIIRYLQRQFRGYHLDEAEVREVLDRIALYRARCLIIERQPGDDPALRSLLQHFDGAGRLLAGHGGELGALLDERGFAS